jgi:hypothetical protein
MIADDNSLLRFGRQSLKILSILKAEGAGFVDFTKT